VEKATSELRSAPSASSDELTKQHAEELRTLEERLVSKHQEELRKAAEEAAASKVQESAPASGAAITAEEQKAAIDAAVVTAIAAKEGELKAKHDAAIEKAVESGRLEGTMKLRLKDTQLIKAQNKVKELEGQIEQWKRAGIIPVQTAGQPASGASATSPSTTAPSPSVSAPSPTTSAPPRGGAIIAPVRKPSVANTAAGNAAAATGQPARGRGRGATRGSIGIRGAAAPGTGRGTGAPQSSAGTGGTAGVAIMGAAAKRTREEGDASTEDSLSKRLKPALTATATATTTATTGDGNAGAASTGSNTGGKPITLQRNRVQPS
jgi:nucleoprotein TPR